MIRVLEVVLGGGGALGALFGWLTVKWLDAREDERRLKRKAVAARPAVHPRDLDNPWPALPPANMPDAVPWPTELIGPGVGVVLPPDPPLPFTPPPPLPGFCQSVYGYHTCVLPPGHHGDHICTCVRLPGPHHFSSRGNA